MWWWGGYHWWPGPVLMAGGMLVCVAVMALMMGRGRMPGIGGMGGHVRLLGPEPPRTAPGGHVRTDPR